MEYKVLFRIEKLRLVEKLKGKITNYRKYLVESGDTAQIEIVASGDIVDYKFNLDEFFQDKSLKIKLCNNALGGKKPAYQMDNIEVVPAGIGQIIKRKAEGWIEYTIE